MIHLGLKTYQNTQFHSWYLDRNFEYIVPRTRSLMALAQLGYPHHRLLLSPLSSLLLLASSGSRHLVSLPLPLLGSSVLDLTDLSQLDCLVQSLSYHAFRRFLIIQEIIGPLIGQMLQFGLGHHLIYYQLQYHFSHFHYFVLAFKHPFQCLHLLKASQAF